MINRTKASSPGDVEQGAYLTDFELHLFGEGNFLRAWEKFGAHPIGEGAHAGTRFAVWAPNAETVSVIGEFNDWDDAQHPLRNLGDSGVWEGFVPGVTHGALYKFAIRSRHMGYHAEKSDPFGFFFEMRPRTASVVWDLSGYEWGDTDWMNARQERNALDAPMSTYEVHLGSWMRAPEEGQRWLTYRELADKLAKYVVEMGFTHIQLMPVGEHPFDGSWGYQQLGYFAPTSRFGTPQDFMYFVDTMHRHGIGVILDWVPAHFPRDGHGLGYFDGTHLYEHADPRQGLHRDWGTFIFNYGRKEVVNFLISNALYWIELYHLDGLRVDAVASMLYLDYSREEGDWIPNKHGGRENLDAIEFVKQFNRVVYEQHPGVMTIAEESTAWPMVSRPTYLGGLGFGLKWNMGWMHDTLKYISLDPVHRRFHHHQLSFGLLYAFHENFVLPFSHDEVVHGKGNMLSKMPGDVWQQFANLRALYGYMYAHPGKKLLFMGSEFGQWDEWNHDASLDWHLLDQPPHTRLKRWVRDLNNVLRWTPALHQTDFDPSGFEWVDCNDSEQSVLAFLRWDRERRDPVLCLCNFTPVPRPGYRVGVPYGGEWEDLLNSDATIYGGGGLGSTGPIQTTPKSTHGQNQSLEVMLPPLATVLFRRSTRDS